MQQIVNPITAKALNRNNMAEVEDLYKKSSVNLLIAGGLLFLLINLNVKDLYLIIDKPEYTVGIAVVLIISVSEMFKLAAGTNSAILTNSKYYKILFYFSLGMAGSVIVLNRIFIERYGINGAALATLIVVVLFNLIKLWYVYQKLQIHPVTKKTWIVVLLIVGMYLVFKHFDLSSIALLNIVLKSVIIVIIYIFLVYKLNISREFNDQINLRFFRKRS
jgi:O-antigen/teichoic acid export membrane protein